MGALETDRNVYALKFDCKSSAYCMSYVSCDTKEWLQERHDEFCLSHRRKDGNRSVIGTDRLRRLVDRKQKKADVDSLMMHTIPETLRLDGFLCVLVRHTLPFPWDDDLIHNFVILSDEVVVESENFLLDFEFQLVVWWTSSESRYLYVTLEAEHKHGIAQCTYDMPDDHALHNDIVRLLQKMPLVQLNN